MTAPRLPIPINVPVHPADATQAVPRPPRMNEVQSLQQKIQRDLANGYSREEISARLQQARGISLDDFERQTAVSAGNIGRAGAMGATAGFADEIIGAATAAPGPLSALPGPLRMAAGGIAQMLSPQARQRYEAGRESVRQPYEMFRGAHPFISGAAEIGGGLLAPGLGAAGAASRAPGLLQTMRAGATAGAGMGALAGAGYAPEMEDVPGAAAIGGGAGGLLGGAGGAVAEGLVRAFRGGAGARLNRAIGASGGEGALARAAREATESGRGRVQPIGALSPYLRGEAEFAATRSPAVFARQRPRVAQARASDAERLIRDVSEITDAPAVGDEALRAARATEFKPLYDAIEQTATPLAPEHTREVVNLLNRPYVKTAYQEAVNEGLMSGSTAQQPGFAALNNLRQHLRSAQDRAFNAGDGARGAAFKEAANDLENILERAVPEFRAVQSAYREASRPINIIELAKLETARQGRVAPALDRASRDLRRSLMREFGSASEYRDFMRRVALEGELAQFDAQVFGGSATARRLESTGGMRPEDVVEAGTRPTGWASRMLERAVPQAVHERAARHMAPFVFSPASQFDEALAALRRLRERQSAGPFMRGTTPALMGLLGGRTAGSGP